MKFVYVRSLWCWITKQNIRNDTRLKLNAHDSGVWIGERLLVRLLSPLLIDDDVYRYARLPTGPEKICRPTGAKTVGRRGCSMSSTRSRRSLAEGMRRIWRRELGHLTGRRFDQSIESLERCL